MCLLQFSTCCLQFSSLQLKNSSQLCLSISQLTFHKNIPDNYSCVPPTLISSIGDVINLTSWFLIKCPSSGRVVPTRPRGGSTSCRRYFLITLSPRAIWQKALTMGTTFSCSGLLVAFRRSSRTVNMALIANIL